MSATLHMLCGKIAAGKSTLATKLAQADKTVLMSEDIWLSDLFSDQMTTPADFMRCSGRLRACIGPHISSILRAGVSVVLDFQANTIESRAWMREVFEAAHAQHQLHFLNPPDEVCLTRLRLRNTKGEHRFQATEAQFHQVSKHFVPPTPGEGFQVVRYEDAF